MSSDPTALGVALGTGGQRVGVWVGRFQNRGPSTVYRAHAATKPDPASLRGFRHTAGDIWTETLLADSPETWLWTAADGATVVAESGDFA